MSKHTPGPWEINERYIIARSKRGLRTICQWSSYSDEPNARLIAAAPDLLAALRAMVDAWDMSGEEGQHRRIWDDARAAIAKAEAVS